jgi:hypothetical protein
MDENQKCNSIHQSCEVVDTFQDCNSEIHTPLAGDPGTDSMGIFSSLEPSSGPLAIEKIQIMRNWASDYFPRAAPGRMGIALGNRVILSIS